MDRISKALKKINERERGFVKEILVKLESRSSRGLDIKKLKRGENIFRARKGKLRVIYKIDKGGRIFVLAIERRAEKTYKKF